MEWLRKPDDILIVIYVFAPHFVRDIIAADFPVGAFSTRSDGSRKPLERRAGIPYTHSPFETRRQGGYAPCPAQYGTL
ncbi:hypothetical protein DVR09_10890 [Erythrobacter aureus]|uniref:Uncharacterized protein n=1 Tax=Erythrobacter aureus TaxID=2182384 RepID=A0A345YFR4_9SPHN|nr:hypothetical protein DVR09_10890 [Erythrobacter aureus]